MSAMITRATPIGVTSPAAISATETVAWHISITCACSGESTG